MLPKWAIEEARAFDRIDRAIAAKEGGPHSSSAGADLPDWPFKIFPAIIALGIVISVLNGIATFLVSRWAVLHVFLKSAQGMVTASIGVVLLGAGLFWLKEKKLFIYAALELAVAVVTAVQVCSGIKGPEERVATIIALFGAVYISVRAFSNLNDWRKRQLDASGKS